MAVFAVAGPLIGAIIFVFSLGTIFAYLDAIGSNAEDSARAFLRLFSGIIRPFVTILGLHGESTSRHFSVLWTVDLPTLIVLSVYVFGLVPALLTGIAATMTPALTTRSAILIGIAGLVITASWFLFLAGVEAGAFQLIAAACPAGAGSALTCTLLTSRWRIS